MADENLEKEVLEEEVQLEEEVIEELGEDGEPIAKEVEAWMSDDEDDQKSDTVHKGVLIRAKKKLKGTISEQKDEIAELRAEIAQFKAGPSQNKPAELPKRPRKEDFDTDEDYEVALDVYSDERMEARFKLRDSKQQMQTTQTQQVEAVSKAVDAHYERATILVEKNGISPEVYQAADKTVREAVEAVAPGRGNGIVDQAISVLGDDSEKIMYKLGRSKGLLGQFIAIWVENPIKATVFLGEQKAILLNTKPRKTNAPAIDIDVNGDDTPNAKAGLYKRKYEAATKKGSPQTTYNIRKDAKKAGVDVSGW